MVKYKLGLAGQQAIQPLGDVGANMAASRILLDASVKRAFGVRDGLRVPRRVSCAQLDPRLYAAALILRRDGSVHG